MAVCVAPPSPQLLVHSSLLLVGLLLSIDSLLTPLWATLTHRLPSSATIVGMHRIFFLPKFSPFAYFSPHFLPFVPLSPSPSLTPLPHPLPLQPLSLE